MDRTVRKSHRKKRGKSVDQNEETGYRCIMIWVLQNSYFCQLLCCKLIPGLITNKYLHSPCGRNFFEYFEKKIIQLLTRKLQIPIFSKINGNTLKIDGMQSHDLILNLGFKVLQTGTPPPPPSSIPPGYCIILVLWDSNRI